MTTYNGNSTIHQQNHRMQQNTMRIDPTYGRQRIASERRHARGPLMPILFLTLELTLILQLIYTVGLFHIGWLTGMAIVAGIYTLFTSCLPRFQGALYRQKYYR